MFKAEMFDPDEWADLFKKAGAQCIYMCVCVCSLHVKGYAIICNGLW